VTERPAVEKRGWPFWMLVFFHSERNMLYKCASEMEKTMYQLNEKQPVRVEEATFSDIGWKESDIEDLLRKNVDMICDDEESMLIVGQQVHNAGNGRSDLIAMDNNGNIVLIEIKRDKRDIEGRKEAFEFQAIRYAATCATIKSSDELIQNIFAPYVEKHKDEFDNGPGLTSSEIAQRQFNDFIDRNGIKNFNENQRIILVAGDFDGQTLSAVAWLNSYHVDNTDV
jgi:RecB family endonuclease NucS